MMCRLTLAVAFVCCVSCCCLVVEICVVNTFSEEWEDRNKTI
jgi:hypothetical protein